MELDKLSKKELVEVLKKLLADESLKEEKAAPKKRGRPKKKVSEVVHLPPTPVVIIEKRAGRVQGSPINLFTQMEEFNEHKDDNDFDKKVSKDRMPVERGTRPSGLVKLNCPMCGKQFEIHPALVLKDQETGEISTRCNNCSRKPSKG